MTGASTGELPTGGLTREIIRSAAGLLIFQDADAKLRINHDFASLFGPYANADLKIFLTDKINPCLPHPDSLHKEDTLPNNFGMNFLKTVAAVALELREDDKTFIRPSIAELSARVFELKGLLAYENYWAKALKHAARFLDPDLDEPALKSIIRGFRAFATGQTNGTGFPQFYLSREATEVFNKSLSLHDRGPEAMVRDSIEFRNLHPALLWTLNSLVAAYAVELERPINSQSPVDSKDPIGRLSRF